MSIAGLVRLTGIIFSLIAFAKPVISLIDSPLDLRAIKKPEISISV